MCVWRYVYTVPVPRAERLGGLCQRLEAASAQRGALERRASLPWYVGTTTLGTITLELGHWRTFPTPDISTCVVLAARVQLPNLREVE